MAHDNTPAEKLARAVAADKQLLRTIVLNGLPHDVWTGGKAVIVTMTPPDKGPARIRVLVEDRREAILTGTCPLCLVTIEYDHSERGDGYSLHHGALQHDGDCLLTDENLSALIQRSYGGTKRNWWSRKVWDEAS